MKKLYLDVKNGIDEISLLKLLAEISKDLSPDALSKVNRIFVIRAKDNIKEWITNLKIKGSIKKHILNILEICKKSDIKVTKKDLVIISSIAYLLEEFKLNELSTSALPVNYSETIGEMFIGSHIIVDSDYPCSNLCLAILKEFNVSTTIHEEIKLDKTYSVENLYHKKIYAFMITENNIIELVTNIDDMSEEYLAFAIEELYKKGALDVYTTNIYMKKGRNGVMLTCMCYEKDRETMLKVIFKHTTTIGIREYHSLRYGLKKEIKTIHTEYGAIREKITTGYNTTKSKYEYEDLAKIAHEQKKTIKEVIEIAEKLKEKDHE